MTKRLQTAFLALVMLLGICIPAASPWQSSAAAQGVTRWYGDQLNEKARLIYDTLEDMAQGGSLMSGTASVDLCERGLDASAYVNNSSLLIQDYGAARDAFCMDHAGLFYVNWSNFSVRLTQGSDGYHAIFGPGSTGSYAQAPDQFPDLGAVQAAVTEYANKVKEVADAARAAGDTAVKQVTYVHDYLTQNVEYKLETDCNLENIHLVNTSYGALIRGQAVCEGYARAFKDIMDELDIPCLLQVGVYRMGKDEAEPHMWALVKVAAEPDAAFELPKAASDKLDGTIVDEGAEVNTVAAPQEQWYAVDVTMDDPIPYDGYGKGGVKTGLENQDHLMIGSAKLSRHHQATGVMSESGFTFQYPELAEIDAGMTRKEYDGGLFVEYDPNAHDGADSAGIYKVNFRGMGYAKAAEQGYYLLIRHYYYNSEILEGDWEFTPWIYLDPTVYENDAFADRGDCVELVMAHMEYTEFAVTDRAPGTMEFGGQVIPDSFYHGKLSDLLARTGMLHNISGGYEPPPMIARCSPSPCGSVDLNEGTQKSYDYVVRYTQPLQRSLKLDAAGKPIAGEYEDLSITIDCTGPTGAEYAKIDNLQWSEDDPYTVRFTFTPSNKYADDKEFYTFTINGLCAKNSKYADDPDMEYFEKYQRPAPVGAAASYPCSTFAYAHRGIDWNAYAKPQLLENLQDLDVSDWEFADGKVIGKDSNAAKLTDRMVLMVSDASGEQRDGMQDLINGQGEAIENSEKIQYYDIKLSLCKVQIVKTGQKVRIMLGFPEGYGPESAGVTFKAYHFTSDEKTGEVIGIEEMECTITEYGLVILCDSFSPFALVPVKSDDTTAPAKKTILVTTDGPGVVTVNGEQNGLLTLAPDEACTLNVKASDGYVIDAIAVGGKTYAEGIGQTSADVTVRYADLAQKVSGLVDVRFVKADIKEKEEQAGQKVVLPGVEQTNEPTQPEQSPKPDAVPPSTYLPDLPPYPDTYPGFAGGSWEQPGSTPQPAQTTAPTQQPAQSAAPAPQPTAAPAGSGSGTGGGTAGGGTAGENTTPTPTSARPTTTPNYTTKPTQTPPTPTIAATPSAQPAESAGRKVPPLAIAGIVAAVCLMVGGIAWMFWPQRRHHRR